MATRIKIVCALFWCILEITSGWFPKMALLPVVIPFLSFFCIAINGRFIGYRGAALLTCMSMFFATIASGFVFIAVCLYHQIIIVTITPWIAYKNLIDIKWEFLFDSLTAVMMLVVCFISLLVHVYSVNYMWNDPHFAKFMGFLSLFTFFMLMLVTSNNLLQLFFGWEGVGISSYLLINFWHKRIQANKAAIKAILFNRVGDMGLALAIGLAFYMFKSVNFEVIFPAIEATQWADINILGFSIDPMDLLAFLLFVGAAGKSAQLGLHTWLPDAMEGPTPVSALIHAATMVTAGVFVLIRCGPILDQSEPVLSIINFVGALTAFFAASTALFQNDLKRIIAYSTCSQLGYMISICGLSAYNVSLFHLVNHAFFKALLFLGAGAIIHNLNDEQDIRRMGGIAQILPIFYVVTLIGSMSLMGLPYLTGFYSKEIIMLADLTSAQTTVQFFSAILLIASAMLTAAYSMRLIWIAFLREYGGYRGNLKEVHENDEYLLTPLVILAICSIYIGYFGRDFFIGQGTDIWGTAIDPESINRGVLDAEFYPTSIKLMPLILSLISVLMVCIFHAYIAPNWPLVITKINQLRAFSLYTFFNNKWHFDIIYESIIIRPFLVFCKKFLFIEMDRGGLEKITTMSSIELFKWLYSIFNKIFNGFLPHYIYFIVFSFGILMIGTHFEFWVMTSYTFNFIVMSIINAVMVHALYTEAQKNKDKNDE